MQNYETRKNTVAVDIKSRGTQSLKRYLGDRFKWIY
jgi:hypothetical protein